MKMRFLAIALVFGLFIFLAVYFFPGNSISSAFPELKAPADLTPEILPFSANESINYTVKIKGISVGKASLIYKGIVKLADKEAHLIILTTNTFNFKDTETMYADFATFLPLRIERDINKWGEKIRIVEDYDQENNIVRIKRIVKDRDIIKEIKQDEKIQNVILSTYLRRKTGDFVIGREFPLTLPLSKIIMRITKEASVHVPFGSYAAYLFESFPKGYQIWFEPSKKFIPVRISGPSFLGVVNMVMTDYKER